MSFAPLASGLLGGDTELQLLPSVALSYRCPGCGQPGDGALELGVPDTDLAQAGVVHGGGRGDGQRGGEARVGGSPQELGGQASGYGAGSGARRGEGGAGHGPQAGVLTVDKEGDICRLFSGCLTNQRWQHHRLSATN